MAIQEGSNWEGMVEWWSHHSAHSYGTHGPPGTHHSYGTHRAPAHSYGSEEDQKTMPTQKDVDVVVDPAERVYEIAFFLNVNEDEDDDDCGSEYLSPAQMEETLDELQGYVKSIDVAKKLHSYDSLVPLFYNVLNNKNAGVRAKAAEVVTTMVQNNPTSQQLVMEVNGLSPLLYHISDPDVTARTKVLGAISALIWNNKPGITAFRLQNGYAILRDAWSTECVTFQREALNLIQYLLRENSSDCNIVTEFGFPRIMMHLTSSDDAEVREAALRGLLVLARDEGGNSGQLVKNDDKLKQVLQERIEGISAMAPGDLGAAWEERQLVDSLWNACYNEPSSLREKGLLVLPGEDAPAPDVASKLFEPPPSAATPTVQSN